MKKPRVRFRWLAWPRENEQAIQCHAHRCDLMAVEHRLCADHNAAWLANQRMPQMPETYGGVTEQSALLEEIAEDMVEAEASITRLSLMPLRNSHDAKLVDKEYQTFEEALTAAQRRKDDSIAPLLESAEKLEALQAPLIQRYRDGAALARMRLDGYRSGGAQQRESIPVARHPVVVGLKRRQAARHPKKKDRE